MGASNDPDQALAELARRQHGVVAYGQLLALGFGRRAIARRVERGRLHRLHVGVFAVGHVAMTREGRWLAATMACGPGAVLSHAAAANVWGLRRSDAAMIDVTVRRGGRKAPSGVRLHRRTAAEGTSAGGLPVTTVAQTLLDLATILPQRRLERALEEAEQRHLDTSSLTTLLAAHPHRHGAPTLRRALEMHGAGGATLTRSRLEERFIELCDDHGIPRPRANQHVAGYEVDFVWREQGLIAETDGWRHHRAWSAFEADRRRDALLTVRGWTVVRVTYARLLGEPAVVAGELHALLSRRGPRRAGAGARRPPGRRPR